MHYNEVFHYLLQLSDLDILALTPWAQLQKQINLLLIEHKGAIGQYWPEVVQHRTNIIQYSLSKVHVHVG